MYDLTIYNSWKEIIIICLLFTIYLFTYYYLYAELFLVYTKLPHMISYLLALSW